MLYWTRLLVQLGQHSVVNTSWWCLFRGLDIHFDLPFLETPGIKSLACKACASPHSYSYKYLWDIQNKWSNIQQVPSTYLHFNYFALTLRAQGPLIADDRVIVSALGSIQRDGALRQADHPVWSCIGNRWIIHRLIYSQRGCCGVSGSLRINDG